MEKRYISLLLITIWICIVLAFMLVGEIINIEIFFVLWLITMVIIVEISKTSHVQTIYISNLYKIIGIGVIIFVCIVIKNIIGI